MPCRFNSPGVYACRASWFLWVRKNTTGTHRMLWMGSATTLHCSLKMCLSLCISKSAKPILGFSASNSKCPISDTGFWFTSSFLPFKLATKTGCMGHSANVVVTGPSRKLGQKCSIRGSASWRGAVLVCAAVLRQSLGVRQVTRLWLSV